MRDHIVEDLSRHAIDKCRRALLLAVELAETPSQKFEIATMVATATIGMAAGTFAAVLGTDAPRNETIVELLDIIKSKFQTPGVVKSEAIS